jgi:hypothetical protein
MAESGSSTLTATAPELSATVLLTSHRNQLKPPFKDWSLGRFGATGYQKRVLNDTGKAVED